MPVKQWEFCIGIDYVNSEAEKIAQSCYLIVLGKDQPRFVGSYKDTWWDRQCVFRNKTGLNYFSHGQAYNVRDAIDEGHVVTLWVLTDPFVTLPNGVPLNCSRCGMRTKTRYHLSLGKSFRTYSTDELLRPEQCSD
jgi:hypothetical protein